MATERVILVDEHDNQIGTEEKIKAHREGKLHRAFSIFVFNDAGDMLIQQRALAKYHTGGLWANSCCSHPRPDEETSAAAHRRLQEEMGFDCPLEKAFSFTYKVKFDKDKLFEHEFDHVFIGTYNGPVEPNAKEVHDTRWISLDALALEIQKHPEQFAYWFLVALEKLVPYLKEHKLA